MTKQDVIRDIQKVAEGDGLATITELSKWWGISSQALSRKLKPLSRGYNRYFIPDVAEFYINGCKGATR